MMGLPVAKKELYHRMCAQEIYTNLLSMREVLQLLMKKMKLVILNKGYLSSTLLESYPTSI